jgi:hypothetical protein
MTDKDYLQERFEIRQTLNILIMADECIHDFLFEARTEIDADHWQDALVLLRSAKECLPAASSALERLDKSTGMLAEKIRKERVE